MFCHVVMQTKLFKNCAVYSHLCLFRGIHYYVMTSIFRQRDLREVQTKIAGFELEGPKVIPSWCLQSRTRLLGTHEYMSQQMTFLYSPQLGNRSSRPVTKPTAMISKAWRPGRTPNLDRMIAPLRMRVDTVSYPHAHVVRPPEMTLYREAYWP